MLKIIIINLITIYKKLFNDTITLSHENFLNTKNFTFLYLNI